MPSAVAMSFLSSESGALRDPAGRRRTGASPSTGSSARCARSWSPRCAGSRTASAPSCWRAKEVDARFTDQDLRLARGIADITSLALGNARRLSELERFHELVASLDAVFWEADAASLDSPSSAAGPKSSWAPTSRSGSREGRRWGDHIAARGSRRGAVTAARIAADAGQDHSLEYRVSAPDGRDDLDPRHDPRGAQAPRGRDSSAAS